MAAVLGLAIGGCKKSAHTVADVVGSQAPSPVVSRAVTPAAVPSATPEVTPRPTLPTRVDPEEAKKVFAGLRVLADRKDVSAMAPFLYGRARAMLARMPPEQVTTLFQGDVVDVNVNGGRVLLKLAGNPMVSLAAMFLTDSGFKYDLAASMSYRDADDGPRLPENRSVPLADAVAGISGTGKLMASIKTSEGEFTCELFEDKAPLSVANFVALARGLRGFRDVSTGKWVKRPFYDGLTFHRVIPKFMIQGGCPKGDGTGDPGYSFKDEFDLSLRHDRPGRLSMANSGPNTNGTQFFITDAQTAWLDDHHSIFGQCEPVDLVSKIARVPATDSKPQTPVVIESIRFERQ